MSPSLLGAWGLGVENEFGVRAEVVRLNPGEEGTRGVFRAEPWDLY